MFLGWMFWLALVAAASGSRPSGTGKVASPSGTDRKVALSPHQALQTMISRPVLSVAALMTSELSLGSLFPFLEG